MKILYIANVRIPTDQAHGWAVMKMCEALVSAGAEVELIVPRRLNSIKEEAFEFYSMKRTFRLTKVPSLDLTRWGKIGFFIQWVSFACLAVLYSIRHKADCYYGRDELSLWLISFLKKDRVVWEAHTAKSNWLVRALLRKIHSVVAISNGIRERLLDLAKNVPILVLPSGFDQELFNSVTDTKEVLRNKFNLPLHKIIVAYVGKLQTFGESKGVEKLEEAVRIIKEKHDDVELLVVSEASPIDVPAYMKASDILVMNYPNREHYAKFMSPLKLFEYMASGNPIATSDLPTVREIVDESMVSFFEPDNPKSLARAVNYLIENPEEAKAKSARARDAVKQYSWQERAKRVLKFISI